MKGFHHKLALIVFGWLTVIAPSKAAAFCRSTTCTGSCARNADGCKTKGEKLRWPSSCVGFSMHVAASEFIDLETARGIMQNAAAAWSDVDCGGGERASFAFSAANDVACHKAEYNAGDPNANIILFQDTRWKYKGVNNNIAKTTVSYDNETGEIFDADIEFNHAFNELTVGQDHVVYDLASIATHEFGHFLGLDHTQEAAATMNAGYSTGSTKLRDLEPDDIAGLCDIYPPGQSTQCKLAPTGGFSEHCADEDPEDEGGCSVAPLAMRAEHSSIGLRSLWSRRKSPASRSKWGLLGLFGVALGLRRRRSRPAIRQ